MRRLKAAGFKGFAETALLPDWWDESCADDAGLLPDLEIRVARFLGSPLDAVRDPTALLRAPLYSGAQLRRVRDISRDRLASAIHAGIRVADAVVRNMHPKSVNLPPQDALKWRASLADSNNVLQLDAVVSDLWSRGIPVIQITALPSPAFQGLASIVDGHPVVIIGHDRDEPSRLAFVIAHEVAHIVFGHCTAEHPIVDEDENVPDGHEMEVEADQYAGLLLTGTRTLPTIQATDYRSLATQVEAEEKRTGIDASSLIWTWARRNNNYQVAAMAEKAIYRHKGGKRTLRRHFDASVEVLDAPDSDRSLFRCLGQ